MSFILPKECEDYRIILGVIPGYYSEEEKNIVKELSEAEIIDKISKCQDAIEDDTGIYVSLVIGTRKCLYKKEWGCPPGGELVYELSATRNPHFNPDKEKFKFAVKKLTELLKSEFQQKTVTMTISESNKLYYFNRG